MKAGTELRPLDRDLAATVALAAYSIVVGLGFARVFGGWDFADDVIAIVVVGHGASFALRRLRVSGWVAVPAVVLLLMWLIALQSYRSTFNAVFPTGATWDLFRLETGLVREQFRTAVAPVLYGAGWATLSGLAIMAVVVLSDTFAFRAEARGEALVPGGVLYVFIAALGTDRSAALGTDQSRVTLTAALIATGVPRRVHASRPCTTGGGGSNRRHPCVARVRSCSRPRSRSAIAIGVLAGVIGPRLPGADAEPLYHTRNRGGVTEVLSPLVDIRSRLVNRTNTLLFRVSSPVESNWRYTSLPEFDGRQFRLPERDLDDAAGSLGTVREGAEPFTHEIQIQSLGGQLVPAAADPIRASPSDSLQYNADTSTLLKLGDELGLGEHVHDRVGVAATSSPMSCGAAPREAPPDPDLPRVARRLPGLDRRPGARGHGRQRRPTTTPRSRSRTGSRASSSYSLQVQSGHGTSAIESFLIERVGYCEQFAATFAAMARTLDIPSRVAVGFTSGLQGLDDWYGVLGKNAHAWPELWFGAAIGWVPFEPTPGRGIPGAESYTGIPAQQDTTPAQAGTGDRPPVTPTTRPTAGDVQRPDAQIHDSHRREPRWPPRGPRQRHDRDRHQQRAADVAVRGDRADRRDRRGTAVVRRLRRRMLRRAPAEERIVHAWERATSSLRLAGVGGRPSMTTREWATATATVLPVAARPMWSLSGVVDSVTFGTPGMIDLEAVGPYGSSVARDCTAWAHQIDEIVAETLTPRERLVRYATDWG